MLKSLGTILLLVFSLVLLAQKSQNFLLEPSGSYTIGTTELFLTDSSRKEPIKKSYKGYRRLYVKVWYPSDEKENLNYSKYFSEYSTETIHDIFKSKKVPIDSLHAIKQYDTHSCKGIELSNQEPQFPVIIFNSGFYFGMTDLYSNFMELLASNGYIVFSVVHPYQQPLVYFPDGKAELLKKKALLPFLEWKLKERIKVEEVTTPEIQEEYTKNVLRYLKLFGKITRFWTVDNQFVLDYLDKVNKDSKSFFYQKLNLEKIGAFGQSIGGAAIGQLAYADKRIKAGINIDCFQFGDIIDHDLETPFMTIESEFEKKWNLGNESIFSTTKSDFYSLLLLKSDHFISCDVPLLPILNQEQRDSFYGKVDGKKAVELMNSYILDFFNLYLRNISSETLKKEVKNSDVIYKVR